MDSETIRLACEVTALRFILATVVANNLARMDDGEEQLIAFQTAVDRAMRFRATVPPGADADAAQAVQTAALAAARRFFEETADRFVEIQNMG